MIKTYQGFSYLVKIMNYKSLRLFFCHYDGYCAKKTSKITYILWKIYTLQ